MATTKWMKFDANGTVCPFDAKTFAKGGFSTFSVEETVREPIQEVVIEPVVQATRKRKAKATEPIQE